MGTRWYGEETGREIAVNWWAIVPRVWGKWAAKLGDGDLLNSVLRIPGGLAVTVPPAYRPGDRDTASGKKNHYGSYNSFNSRLQYAGINQVKILQ